MPGRKKKQIKVVIMAEELPKISLEEKLKGLKEWRQRILASQPKAYTECPGYMRMVDRQIAEAEELLSAN